MLPQAKYSVCYETSVPGLGLWGEHDPITPPAYGRAFTRAFAHSSFQAIPGAGHLPTHDAPDLTFAAIDSFLQAPRSARAT